MHVHQIQFLSEPSFLIKLIIKKDTEMLLGWGFRVLLQQTSTSPSFSSSSNP